MEMIGMSDFVYFYHSIYSYEQKRKGQYPTTPNPYILRRGRNNIRRLYLSPEPLVLVTVCFQQVDRCKVDKLIVPSRNPPPPLTDAGT